MSSVSSPLRPQWQAISQKDFREMYGQLGSLQELADFWEIPASQLTYYAFRINKDSAYRTFSIARRYGRQRLIEAPARAIAFSFGGNNQRLNLRLLRLNTSRPARIEGG